tara:strand:+ start:295 stop:825 length:531 start_codon:yes stop_codon:yes gene_type:complete
MAEETGILRSLINKIPANVRFFTTDVLGIDTPADNTYFTEDQIQILKDSATSALDKGKRSMTYEDYPSGKSDISYQDKGIMELANKMMDDEFQMRTTIGAANLTIDANGDIILTDRFNFNDAQDVKDLEDAKNAIFDIFGTDGAYKKIRKVGTYAGSGEGFGAPIELNLGQYSPKT